MKDYYGVLEVPMNATLNQIKESRNRLIKKWHPDKNRDNIAEAEQKTMEINEAYSVLTNKSERTVYDFELGSQFSSYGIPRTFSVYNELNDLYRTLYGHDLKWPEAPKRSVRFTKPQPETEYGQWEESTSATDRKRSTTKKESEEKESEKEQRKATGPQYGVSAEHVSEQFLNKGDIKMLNMKLKTVVSSIIMGAYGKVPRDWDINISEKTWIEKILPQLHVKRIAKIKDKESGEVRRWICKFTPTDKLVNLWVKGSQGSHPGKEFNIGFDADFGDITEMFKCMSSK